MKLRTFFIALFILIIVLFSTLTIVIKTGVMNEFFSSIFDEIDPDRRAFSDDIFDDEFYEETETDD